MSAAPATGADALAEALRQVGVTRVFGLPGVHNLAAWAALEGSPIHLIGVRHEQTAVYAADGEARVAGKLGVAITTTGPGAANALAATGEAWASGSPVLVIATDIPTTLRRPGVYRGALHETRDQAGMFAPVAKRVLRATSADEIGALIREAAATATASPSGPVYVEIPTDLLSARTGRPREFTDLRQTQRPVDEELLEQAAAELTRAERPLIWAGGGAVRSEAGPAVARVAEMLGAPVIETYQARGLLPIGHPSKVTVSPHAPEIGALWDLADVVLAIGTDFDGMMTQNWALPKPPTLIAIGIDAEDATKAFVPDVLIVADAADAVARLIDRLSAVLDRPAGDRASLREIAGREREAHAAAATWCPDAAVFLATVANLPETTVIFADMCIPGYWLAAYHPLGAPRRFAYPVGWGTLGFAFPAAIGAAAAQDEPVLCVTGDGGFLFACGELAVLAQEQIALTVLIVDDGGYGMLRFDQTHAGDHPFGVDLRTPDFVALARSFGVPARQVAGLGPNLASALAEALAANGPRVIVARAQLKPPVNTSPLWYRR